MKVIVSIVMMSLVSVVSFAQVTKDPQATEVLDKVNAKFKALSSFKADFNYGIESTATGQKENIKGNILVQGAKYKITTDDGKEIYNNGVEIWNYFVDDNEANIYEYDPEEDNMSPLKIVDMYKEGYKYMLKPDESIAGVTCKVIDLEPELTPEERKYNLIYKIRLMVDAKTFEIKEWKIFERNGNRYTMSIEKFEKNVAVSEGDFVFDKAKHPGVVVEDMR